MKTQAYQSLKDYYLTFFIFTVSVHLKKFIVVYHLYGETGLSTVCTNGKQKFLMVIYHLPNNRESLGRDQPDHSSKMAAGTDEENFYFPLEFDGWKFWTTFQDVPFISETSLSVEPKLSNHLHLRNFWVNGNESKFSSV